MNIKLSSTSIVAGMTGIILSGCSLNTPSSQITITLPAGGGPGMQIVSGSSASGAMDLAQSLSDPNSAHAYLAGVAGPVKDTNFTCFGINVTGAGINPDTSLDSCASSGMPGPGLVGGLASVATGGTIALSVPVGTGRLIQLFGVQSSVGCPAYSALTGSKFGTASMDVPYELGRTTTDIAGDTIVKIQASWVPASAKKVFCPKQSGVPTALALTGVSPATLGTCTALKVSTVDPSGNAAKFPSALAVAFSGSVSGTPSGSSVSATTVAQAIFSDSKCTSAVTSSFSIGANAGSNAVYFKAPTTGSYTLTATGVGVTSGTLTIVAQSPTATPSATPTSSPSATPTGTSSGGSTGTSFVADWPLSSASSAKYGKAASMDFTGGILELTQSSQMDGSANSFYNGTFMGSAMYNASAGNGYLMVNSTAGSSNLALDASWTPSWQKIVGYWKLDEASGNYADSSPAGIYTGIPTNSPSYVPGKIGNGYSQNSTNSYVSINGLGTAAAFSPGTGSFSMSAWVKVQATSTPAPTATYVAVGRDGGSGGNSYWLGIANGKFTFSVNGSTAVNSIVSTSDGNWHHIVGVRDSSISNSIIALYVDGAASTTGFGYSTPVIPFGSVSIGKQGSNGTTPNYWVSVGVIDEVAIWNGVALSAKAVSTIYQHQNSNLAGTFTSRIMDGWSPGQSWNMINWITTLPYGKPLPDNGMSEAGTYSSASTSLTTGMAALWHLEEATLNTAATFRDTSGNNNHGTGVTTVFPVAGVFTNGAGFDGSSAINTSFTLGQVTAYSVSAWINTTATGATSGSTSNQASIIQFGSPLSATLPTLLIGKDNSSSCGVSGGITWSILGSTYQSVGVASTSAKNDGNWHHVVGTWASSGSNVSAADFHLYIDGVSATTLCSGLTVSSPLSGGGGSAVIGKSPNNYFAGKLDEVAVWTRALSAQEALQLYRRGANRVRMQVRTCGDSACATPAPGQAWVGMDGTDQSYISELDNTMSGYVMPNAPSPMMTNLPTNRYFQYRAIMESDDTNALCSSYYSGMNGNCSPEISGVAIYPLHYDNSAPAVQNTAVNSYAYTTLTSATQALGSTNGCSGGVRYQLSPDGSHWFYWSASTQTWSTTSLGASQSNTIADVNSHISTFPGPGTALTFKAFLQSGSAVNNNFGNAACELSDFKITGTQ